MALYKYLLPLISVAPPPGYRLVQTIGAGQLHDILDRPKADVVVCQSLVSGGVETQQFRHELAIDQDHRTLPPVRISLDAQDDDAWATGEALPYVETHAEVLGDANFVSHFPPDFYTIYSGPERKSFFSDNALKYGNTVTIYQIQAFGAWVEGYPTSMVDPARDIDESLVLFNPFTRPAVVDVTLEGIPDKRRFRIDATSGRRISLAHAFDLGETGWAGQVYVSGRNRVVMYVAKHSLADPSKVTTIEHSNPYRGEPTHEPATQVLRRRVGTALMRLRARVSGEA